MKGLFVLLLIFVIASPSLCARVRFDEVSSSFNVVTYGATGDGQTDDSQAFMKAWGDVCNSTQGTATLLVPESKTFMLQPVMFQGPCKSTTVNVKLQGNIAAPKSKDWQWPSDNDKTSWIVFTKIDGLVVNGGGQVDGQGAPWWQSNDNSRPTALRFSHCDKLNLEGLTHINSPRNHISINECNGAEISGLHITAPEDSPNTDGIDISGSSNIIIRNSTIETGDDCVAINTGSSFINITGVFCGPGHGISVGSLGHDGQYAKVEEIHVRNCTFTRTSNGARIKTWQGGDGYAKSITYEDIIIIGVKNPVIIDQQYSDLNGKINGKAVSISDVTFNNVKGTSSGKDAITLNCDSSVGCTNIVLSDVNLTNEDDSEAQATCNNAKGTCHSCSPVVSCLSNA